MLVAVLGYDRVDYQKDGVDKSFYKFYLQEVAATGKILFGRRTYEVLTGVKYAEEKLLPALGNQSDIHIGWEKDTKRAFLYVK